MWLFTKNAFLTVVENKKDDSRQTVIVRARVRKDLSAFRKAYVDATVAQACPITFHETYDYPYRSIMGKEEFAKAMYNAAMDIDYRKYKEAVRDIQGSARASFYTGLWGKLIDLEVDKNRIKSYFQRGHERIRTLYEPTDEISEL